MTAPTGTENQTWIDHQSLAAVAQAPSFSPLHHTRGALEASKGEKDGESDDQRLLSAPTFQPRGHCVALGCVTAPGADDSWKRRGGFQRPVRKPTLSQSGDRRDSIAGHGRMQSDSAELCHADPPRMVRAKDGIASRGIVRVDGAMQLYWAGLYCWRCMKIMTRHGKGH